MIAILAPAISSWNSISDDPMITLGGMEAVISCGTAVQTSSVGSPKRLV